MNWNDLTFLIALSRCRSLKAAAQQMGTSHQTAARRLRQLEAQLGARLINDAGHNWSLTQMGEQALAKALEMEALATELEQEVHAEPETYAGRVGISSASWGMDLVVMPALKLVRDQHPLMVFDLLSDIHDLSVHAGAVDLVLRFTETPPQDLIGRKIGTVQFGLFGIASLIEALDAGRLSHVPFVRLPELTHHADQLAALGLRVGAETSVNSLSSLLSAVAQGLGIGVLPKVVAAQCPGLIESQVHSVGGTRSAWVLRHQSSRASVRVRAVEAAIETIGRQLLR